MNTNMTGFSKKVGIIVPWMKVSSALEGLSCVIKYIT